ncbi:MAG: hypothetical protein Q8K74_08230, partial [Candidatus Nitrotoga sp.]|nr:hypothetical protein [Candidatus Nitrotoga sp.]MDP1856021.1 hypothetical protein [Candidatus Nitrotoga sp.]
VVEFMMLLLSKNEADCLTYQHKQRCASVNYPQALNRSANYRASGLVHGWEYALEFLNANGLTALTRHYQENSE